MATVEQLLTEIQGGRTNKQMAEIFGCGEPHYRSVKSGKRQIQQEHIDRLVEHDQLSEETRDRLYAAAGFNPNKLHPAAGQLHALLNDDLFSPSQRDLIADNTTEFVLCWGYYVAAKRNQYNRKWPASVEDCLKGLESLATISTRLRIYLLDTLSAVQLHLSELDDVSQRHQEIAQLWRQIGHTQEDRPIEALNLLHQGDYYREIGDWTRAETAYKRAHDIFHDLGRQAEESRSDRKLAIIQLYRGAWLQAANLLETCQDRFIELAKAQHPNALYEIAKTNYTLGWAYNLSGKWRQAHDAHEQGLAYSREHRTKDGQHDHYMIMLGVSYFANDFRQLQDYAAAEESYKEALQLAQALSDDRALGWIYLGLARVHFRQAQQTNNRADRESHTDMARDYFSQALKVLQKQPHYRYRYAMTLIHAAHFNLWLGLYQDAEMELLRALQIVRDLSSFYYEAEAQVFLCELYYQRKEYYRLESASKAITALHAQHGYSNHMARLRFIEAKACIDQKIDGDAARYLAESIDFALDFNPLLAEELHEQFQEIISQIAKRDTQASRERALALKASIAAECKKRQEATAPYNQEKQSRWKDYCKLFSTLRVEHRAS